MYLPDPSIYKKYLELLDTIEPDEELDIVKYHPLNELPETIYDTFLYLLYTSNKFRSDSKEMISKRLLVPLIKMYSQNEFIRIIIILNEALFSYTILVMGDIDETNRMDRRFRKVFNNKRVIAMIQNRLKTLKKAKPKSLVENIWDNIGYSNFTDYFNDVASNFSGNEFLIEAVAKYWEKDDPISYLIKVKSHARETLTNRYLEYFEPKMEEIILYMTDLIKNKNYLLTSIKEDKLSRVYKELSANYAIISDIHTFRRVIESRIGVVELRPSTPKYEAWLIFNAIFNGFYENIRPREYNNIEILIDANKNHLKDFRKTGHNYKNSRIPKSQRFIKMLETIESILK